MKSNTLMALNNHLFEQIERLSDDDLDLETEVSRAKSITEISKQIIDNAKLSLEAEKLRTEYGGSEYVKLPKMIADDQ